MSRRKYFGSNIKRKAVIKSFFSLILDTFEDTMNKILLLAAFVALIVGIINDGIEHGWIEGSSIFFAVAVIALVNAINNYRNQMQFQELQAKQVDSQNVPVYRGSETETMTIPATELVVGDIIKVINGSKVPADCILIESSDLKCEQSALTGEPDEIHKSMVDETNKHTDVDPFLIGKTNVANGNGKALVVVVGVNTVSGKIGERLMGEGDDGEESKTPLQLKLGVVADKIGLYGSIIAIMTFLIMTIKYVIIEYLTMQEKMNLHPDKPNSIIWIDVAKEIVHFFVIAITIVVVAVPEGLPLAVTIALAYSVSKMKDQNNLVRKMEASETMGGTDQICTDKTGTLT